MTGTSLIATMAGRYEMDPKAFERTMRATAMPSKHSDEQLAAFLMVAHEYKLNPLLREIYAFPNPRTGGVVPVVSIDGWVHLVNAHPACDGYEFEFEEKDGKLFSATCVMWRKDRGHPVIVTEYFGECYRNTDPWNAMPRRMLRHKALIQCARYAFGLAGIYDEDEARDIANAVERIEAPIAARQVENVNSFLDDFASGVVQADIAVSAPPATSDKTAASPDLSPQQPQEAAVAPSPEPDADDEGLRHKRRAIAEQLLGIAARDEPAADRLERLDVTRRDLIENYPEAEAFIIESSNTAGKVVAGKLALASATRYLMGQAGG